MPEYNQFNEGLLEFLAASPTPFHATERIKNTLFDAGYQQLLEADDWCLETGGRYFVIRNGSSIVAFNKASHSPVSGGLRVVGAHTDSPCLKVKPHPEISTQGYFQLGVEVYGGVLLNPWFDRDLSLAGRVSFRDTDGKLKSVLIDYQRAIASVPSLAIHLDRDANKNRTVNSQKDIPPIVMCSAGDGTDFREILLEQIRLQHPESHPDKVWDFELSFYDTQKASVIGLNNEFIASARLDNLLSCYVGLQALLDAPDHHCVLVCNDHEEVGSQSAVGAQGPFLKSVLQRVIASESELIRTVDQSMMISADNAHGVHPNFSDKHDSNHGPVLNQGPVIKINANQRYATNSETSSVFRHMCEKIDQPVQAFVVRSDMGCGSTIGPITASELGIKTLDVGVPTFAMHSIRELAGARDAYSLYRILVEFNTSSDVLVF
jgi:aspartyl aminopeptidase